jgi:hypothetical protein
MSIEALIPAEILSEIFQKSLPRPVDRKGRLAFQIIRSVCPRWRSVSLSSPNLWSSLSVACDRDKPDNYIAQIRYMDGWFARAGLVLPLELHLEELSATSGDVKANDALRAFIRRYEHRWGFLSFCLIPNDLWDVLFQPPSLNMGSLHTFKLWAYDFMKVGDERARHGLIELQKMPALRCIIVQDVDQYRYLEQYGPATLDELHIYLDFFSIEQARLISSYRNLTTLALLRPKALLISPEAHFRWPAVTSFTFETGNLNLLDHLTIPHLENLILRLNPALDRGLDRQPEVLSDFLARSCSRTLKSFTLDSHSDEAFISRVLPTLASLLHLTHLDLDLWPFEQEMAALGEKHREEWFTNLRNMTISMPFGDVRTVERMEGLADFLLRREDFGVAQLETLTVHRRRGAADFPYDSFKEVRVGKLSVMVPW